MKTKKERKEKKEKKEKPRRYPKKSYQGLFRKLFWLGFFCVIGASALSIVRTVNLENWMLGMQKELVSHGEVLDHIPKEEIGMEEDSIEINEEGAKLFACNVATDFYTWNYEKDKAEERIERLSPYLASGLDESAGYDISRLGTASKVTACEVWEMDISGDTVNVIVKVDYVLTEPIKEKKETVDKIIDSGERYLNISLITNGRNFKVNALPYLVQKPSLMAYTLQTDQPGVDALVASEKVSKEIRSFLETFFKFATTGTAEELQYYTKSEVESKKGIYEFIRMDNVSVYQAQGGHKVYVDVWMQDVSTKAEVLLKVTCTISTEQDRFVVSEINY